MISLEIESLSNDGSGVGHYQGMAIFVPQSAPKDCLTVKIVKVAKHHAFGKIETILTPSPMRTPVDCPVFSQCGGCSLRHISYEAECNAKNQFIQDNMQRIGGIPLSLPSLLHGDPFRYRNKVQYPFQLVDGQVNTGFYAPRSHRLIPVEDCLLQPEIFSSLAEVVCLWANVCKISVYDESTGKGLLRHLMMRQGDGGIMVCLVINGRKLPFWQELLGLLKSKTNQLASFVLDHNRKQGNTILSGHQTILFGQPTITDHLAGVELELSATSFYQVNHFCAELLYQKALEFANPQQSEILLDLYCGAGSIGLSMAHQVKRLIGVDVVESAIENARHNAENNQIDNATFFCADAAQTAEQLYLDRLSVDIIVTDPPRSGMSPQTIEAIIKLNPSKLVYISCNSATLARDCKILREYGYLVKKIQGVDLFARTTHVETVVLMSRVNS